MVTQLLSENQVLKDQLAHVTYFLEMNSCHIKQKTFRQLFSTVEDQSSQSLLTDSTNHETEPPPHIDASFFSTPFSQEESKVQELSHSKIETPTTRKWADVCDSAISSIPATKGWPLPLLRLCQKLLVLQASQRRKNHLT